MQSKLDAWQDILNNVTKKDFTGHFRKSKNFGKKFKAAFSQHEALSKILI